MGRRNIYLPEPWGRRLEEAAERRGVSVSALIRLAASSYLEPEELDEPSPELLDDLREAGREIMRGWHEEASVPAEELDPDMPLEAQGDLDYLDDVAEKHGVEGHLSRDAMRAVRRGMREELAELRE